LTSHQEYGTAKGNFGGTVPVAETDGMRTRRECIEWIMTQGHPIHAEDARDIMQHCFAVAAKLLGKEQAEINQAELL
jgi:hypothetical protein